MDTQRTLDQGRIKVMADYREKEVISHLRSLDLDVNETSLDIGDFVFSGNRVVIERKAHSDFVSSIIDGRLFEQSRLMGENFKRPVVIIEGHSDRIISENALKAATASLVVDHGVSLISTKNPLDTAKTIYWIAKKEHEESKGQLYFKVGKKPKDERLLQEFIVSSLPGVSAKTAKKILEEFGTVNGFFNSESERLENVVGKKKAEKILGIINRKYL